MVGWVARLSNNGRVKWPMVREGDSIFQDFCCKWNVGMRLKIGVALCPEIGGGSIHLYVIMSMEYLGLGKEDRCWGGVVCRWVSQM